MKLPGYLTDICDSNNRISLSIGIPTMARSLCDIVDRSRRLGIISGLSMKVRDDSDRAYRIISFDQRNIVHVTSTPYTSYA